MSIQKIIAGSYLGRVFRAGKGLFLIILSFFALSVFANLIRLQTTPFFIWSMYSTRSADTDTTSLYEVHYNDRYILNITHTWQEPTKNFVFSPLGAYLRMKTNGYTDPLKTYMDDYWLKKHPFLSGRTAFLYNDSIALRAFPAWYTHYLSASLHRPVEKVLVLQKKLRWETDGSLTQISSDTALIIP